MKRNLMIAALFSLGLGCVTQSVNPQPHGILVTVTSARALGADLVGKALYKFADPDANEPLVDAKIRAQFSQRLAQKGYQINGMDPQFLVVSRHSKEMGEEMVPEKHQRESYYEDPRTEYVTQIRNGAPITVPKFHPGGWKTRDKLVPGGLKQIFVKKISFLIYAADSAPPQKPNALPLWEAEVMNSGPQADLLKVSGPMIHELSAEFPIPSGKPETREAFP